MDYDFFDANNFYLHALIPLVIMITTYWTVGSLFTLVDLTGKPEFVTQFRIQKHSIKHQKRVTSSDVEHVVKQVLFNQTVVTFPIIILSFYIKCWRGWSREPYLFKCIRDIFIHLLIEEILFYYSHRFLHHKFMYKRYHKRHHEWISPIGISAIYCHPVEHVLCNVLPTLMGPAVAGTHVVLFWIWMGMTTAYGVIVHSGYHLPLLPSPQAHDFHHAKFTEFFGVIGLLDRLHGTDKQFRASNAFKNHKVLLSWKNS